MSTAKDILRFSTQSSVMGAVAIITILFGLCQLGVTLGTTAGIAGIVIILAALFIGFAGLVGSIGYSFVVFRAAANGRRVVRPVTAEEFRSLWSKRFMSFAVVVGVLLSSVLQLRDALPGFVGEALCLLLILLLPASMALMLLNESLLQAIDPAMQLRMAKELGPPYLLMPLYLAMALGLALVVLAQNWGWPWTPAVICYLWFLGISLCGQVIYTYHDRVGFEPNNEQLMRAAEDERHAQAGINNVLDKAFAHGRTDSQRAINEIQSLFTGDNDTLDFRLNILRQVQTWPNPMVGLRLEQLLITRALALGQETLAFDLVLDGLERNAAFRPAGPNATLKVAAIAKTRARPRIVTALLGDFWTRFEDHPQRAAAALLCARVAIEKTNQPDVARTQLDWLSSLENTRDNPQVAALEQALEQSRNPANSPDSLT
jgi:hypothetical protein